MNILNPHLHHSTGGNHPPMLESTLKTSRSGKNGALSKHNGVEQAVTASGRRGMIASNFFHISIDPWAVLPRFSPLFSPILLFSPRYGHSRETYRSWGFSQLWRKIWSAKMSAQNSNSHLVLDHQLVARCWKRLCDALALRPNWFWQIVHRSGYCSILPGTGNSRGSLLFKGP